MSRPIDMSRRGVAGRADYALRSLQLKHGDKTEDELLQRIWNLAGDVRILSQHLMDAGLAPALDLTMTTCPGGCGLVLLEDDSHGQIAHMNAAHPEIIAERLRAAGIWRQP